MGSSFHSEAVTCAKCGARNPGGRNQCERCGAQLLVQCLRCGVVSPRVLRKCPACHQKLHRSWWRRRHRGLFRHGTPLQWMWSLLVLAIVGGAMLYLLKPKAPWARTDPAAPVPGGEVEEKLEFNP